MRHVASARQAHCLTVKACHASHAGMTEKENMKYPGYRLLPIFAVALALCGCGSLERQPDSTFSGGISRTASADANVEPTRDSRPADSVASTEANVESSHEVGSADQRFNLNLHVFGLSYHPDRKGTRLNHLNNELNVGLGLGYKLHNDARGETNVEAGFFRDSGRNWARFAGVSYQFNLGERWKLGADLLAIQSQTYNKGHGFVAPLPHLTYDFGAVKLNATYIPRVQRYNDFAVFAIYLTIPLIK